MLDFSEIKTMIFIESEMNKWNSDGADSIHYFGLGIESSFPEHREGLTEWKV